MDTLDGKSGDEKTKYQEMLNINTHVTFLRVFGPPHLHKTQSI